MLLQDTSIKKACIMTKKKIFDKIAILVSDKSKISLSTIMHEIQHAKEDLELRKKKGKHIEDILLYYGYNKKY